MGVGDEPVRRLVESDVAVGAQTEHLQIDPAGTCNRALVAFALPCGVRGQSIQEVDVPRVHIHLIQEVAAHERLKAPRIVAGNAEEFVEAENGGTAEVDTPMAVQTRQFPIERDRRASGGKPEDAGRARGERSGDVLRKRPRERLGGDEDVEGQRFYLYRGIRAPPRASASASQTAPDAGSSTSCRT